MQHIKHTIIKKKKSRVYTKKKSYVFVKIKKKNKEKPSLAKFTISKMDDYTKSQKKQLQYTSHRKTLNINMKKTTIFGERI